MKKVTQAELSTIEKSGATVRRKMGAQKAKTRTAGKAKPGRTSYDHEHDHGLLPNGRTTVDNDHDHKLLPNGRTSVDMDHDHAYRPQDVVVQPQPEVVPHAAMAASMAAHEEEMRRIQAATTAKIAEFATQLAEIALKSDPSDYTFELRRDESKLLERVFARPGIHGE